MKEKIIAYKPCPICGLTEIKLHDCNYSSFNCGNYHCENCGFTVDWGFSNSSPIHADFGKNGVWNNGVVKFYSMMKTYEKMTASEIKNMGLDKHYALLKDCIKKCKEKAKGNE